MFIFNYIITNTYTFITYICVRSGLQFFLPFLVPYHKMNILHFDYYFCLPLWPPFLVGGRIFTLASLLHGSRYIPTLKPLVMSVFFNLYPLATFLHLLFHQSIHISKLLLLSYNDLFLYLSLFVLDFDLFYHLIIYLIFLLSLPYGQHVF